MFACSRLLARLEIPTLVRTARTFPLAPCVQGAFSFYSSTTEPEKRFSIEATYPKSPARGSVDAYMNIMKPENESTGLLAIQLFDAKEKNSSKIEMNKLIEDFLAGGDSQLTLNGLARLQEKFNQADSCMAVRLFNTGMVHLDRAFSELDSRTSSVATAKSYLERAQAFLETQNYANEALNLLTTKFPSINSGKLNEIELMQPRIDHLFSKGNLKGMHLLLVKVPV